MSIREEKDKEMIDITIAIKLFLTKTKRMQITSMLTVKHRKKERKNKTFIHVFTHRIFWYISNKKYKIIIETNSAITINLCFKFRW